MSRTPLFKFTSKPKRQRPEQIIQQNIVSWCKLGLKPRVMFHSNVNEGKRGYVDGSNLKKAGMTAGVADLEFIIDGRAHFIEVKAPNEKQTKQQIEFENDCLRCKVPYVVVYSLGEAVKLLSAWGATLNARVAA